MADYVGMASVDLGTSVPSGLALVSVVKERHFDLAEHDIYDSSRLGIKSYYPKVVAVSYTQAGGFTDTMRLWTRRPWYSLQYQELMTQDSVQLYGNGHKDIQPAQPWPEAV